MIGLNTMPTLPIFIGSDPRQNVSLAVASASFMFAAKTKPVSITAVHAGVFGLEREGLTPFTWARFLVPYMCGFKGWALFVDADVLCIRDPAELFALADPAKAVMAVDTSPAFERAAVMLFNCEHPDNAILTPDYIETANGLHQLRWTQNVGWLDKRWNHLVGYDPPRPDPAIIHYTMGVPAWEGKTDDCEHAEYWGMALMRMNSAEPWEDIMGGSQHNGRLASGELVPLYKATHNMKGERLDASPAA